MKRSLLLVLVAGFMSAAYSQEIHWGVEGGLNLSGGIARETGAVIRGDPALGYALGVLADIPLANPRWSIRPNLIFQHEASNADIFGNETNIRVNYIQLPIDVIYHPDFTQKRWVFGLGPWIAYAFSGKYTQSGFTYNIDFGSSDLNDDAHHLDMGLDFLAGYRLKPEMMLTAKFDLGLIDVSSDPQFVTIYTRTFGVSFIYWLPRTMNLPKQKERRP